MPQVKKPQVRQAILAAAGTLFARQSYQATTLSQIARRARVSSANIYVYFNSKLDILYAVYEPWMRARLTALQARLMRTRTPLARLRLVLRTLWRRHSPPRRTASSIISSRRCPPPGRARNTIRPCCAGWKSGLAR